MSIKQTAYDLCKTVRKWPNYDLVRDTVRSRTFLRDPGDSVGRARVEIESAARPLYAQFLGLLVVNQRRDDFAKIYPPLRTATGLDKREVEVLERAHFNLVWLNTRCLRQLLDAVPDCQLAVDPYSKFGYASSGSPMPSYLFDDALANDLVTEFQSHPAVASAVESGVRYRASVPAEKRASPIDLAKTVTELQDEILSLGPRQTPRSVFSARITLQPGTPDPAYFSYLCAMLAINASLHTINELIYRTFLWDKPPFVDDDNIIELGGVSTNSIGSSMSIKFQPGDRTGYGEIGLMLVKPGLNPERDVELCRVEAQSVSMSKELGDVISVIVRVIDDNLCPYPGLLAP